MAKPTKEVADRLEELTLTVEEHKREREAARLERKRKKEEKARRERLEKMVAPALFLLTLLISGVVMLISNLL